jgi:hypothetical protein
MTLTADIVVEKQKKLGWTGARGRLRIKFFGSLLKDFNYERPLKIPMAGD